MAPGLFDAHLDDLELTVDGWKSLLSVRCAVFESHVVFVALVYQEIESYRQEMATRSQLS